MNGGPVQSINYAGRTFSVAQDSEVSLDFGGYRHEEVSMNGDGTGRLIGMVTPAKISGGAFDIDIDTDRDFILTNMKRKEYVDCSVTLCTGQTYSGLMQIIGEPVFNTKQGTMEIELMGNSLK